jgi:hypothetical protein
MFNKKEYNKKWYQKNKKRHDATGAVYRKKHPEIIKNKNLRNKYGITLSRLEHMTMQQEKKCAICKREKELVVDHNHKTNKVRELLCSKCNTALGLFEDSVDLLLSAMTYIEKWR